MKNDILRLTSSVEINLEHPIAAGIVNSSKEKRLELISVHEFRSISGKGIEGHVQAKKFDGGKSRILARE